MRKDLKMRGGALQFRPTHAALRVALMLAPLTLTACAATNYAGIPLTSGAVDAELQTLARRARAGDKNAQLELGIRYEEGRGVAKDLKQARQLYSWAAADDPRSFYIYSPAVGKARARVIRIKNSLPAHGLIDARQRLIKGEINNTSSHLIRPMCYLGLLVGSDCAKDAYAATQSSADQASITLARPQSVRDCSDCPALMPIKINYKNASKPPRLVYFGQNEVTWAEYLSATDNAGCRSPRLLNGTASNPKDRRLRDRVAVTGLSLEDAQCYTGWLSRRTGKRYRLPTSAEWEIAASAGSSLRFPWGETLGMNNAFVDSAFDAGRYKIQDFSGPRSPSNVREVALLAPNRFGLYDVIGNAREMTSSLQSLNICLPREPAPCKRVIARSGPFQNEAGLREMRFMRVAQADAMTGFRIVRD